MTDLRDMGQSLPGAPDAAAPAGGRTETPPAGVCDDAVRDAILNGVDRVEMRRGLNGVERQVHLEAKRTRATLGQGLMWVGLQVIVAGWALGGHFFGGDSHS